jgi:hypothetical protein
VFHNALFHLSISFKEISSSKKLNEKPIYSDSFCQHQDINTFISRKTVVYIRSISCIIKKIYSQPNCPSPDSSENPLKPKVGHKDCNEEREIAPEKMNTLYV